MTLNDLARTWPTALARITPEPALSATHASSRVAGFRGRLHVGTAVLPVAGGDRTAGVTFGIATTALLLRSLSGNHWFPANVPWAVPTGREWRISLVEQTDLRLVQAVGVAVDAVPSRPIRFEGREGVVVRAALRSTTPIWVDDRLRPVDNLVTADIATVRVVDHHRDPSRDNEAAIAFSLMVSWAMREPTEVEDAGMVAVTQLIDGHLADPALSSAMLAERMHVSRRTVQSLFTPHGGVAAFIRRRRVAAALSHLTADPLRTPDLDAVAAATGFGSRRTLERAMRQVYGLTPRQARHQVLSGRPVRIIDLESAEAS